MEEEEEENEKPNFLQRFLSTFKGSGQTYGNNFNPLAPGSLPANMKKEDSPGANPVGSTPVLNLPTSTESLSANNPTAPTASTTPNLNAIKTPDATGQATFSLPGGDMGFVPAEGSIRDESGNFRLATEDQQAAVLRAIQTAPAGPTISSIRTEDAPAAFMDPNNPGSLLYGNQETADRFNEQARQQMQQSIEASQRASKEVTERMLARAQGEVAAREAESRAREQRAAKRSEMFLPPEERSDAGKKRFTDAQLRKMYPDEADRAMAEAGFDPRRPGETFDEQDRSREQEASLAQQQIAANDAQLEQFRKDNRPEYDIALETATNIYNSLLTDFPQQITPQEKDRQVKDLLFDILEQNLGLQNTDFGPSLEQAAIDALALDAQGKGQKTFVYQGKTYRSDTKQEIKKS